jgi:hypothetical protein
VATEQQLTLKFKVNDDGSMVLDSINKKIAAIDQSAQGMGRSLTLIKWDAVTNLASTVSQLGQEFVELAEKGARASAIQDSFNLITKASGVMSDALVERIKIASGVFVQETDIMVKAQQLLVEGFSADQIVKLTEASRVAALKMGTDVASAFDLVSQAVITGRTRAIRAAFPMDESEVMEKYAASIGSVTSMLSEAGRQQALYNEVVRQLTEYTQKYGELAPSQYEQLQKQKSAWAEMGIVIGKAAAAMAQLVVDAAKWMDLQSRKAGAAFGVPVADWMKSVTPGIGSAPPGQYGPDYEAKMQALMAKEDTTKAAQAAKDAQDKSQRLIKQKEFNDAYVKLVDEYNVKIQNVGQKGYQDQLRLYDLEEKSVEDSIKKQYGASMLAKVLPLIDQYYDKQRAEVQKKYGMHERLSQAAIAAEAMYQGPIVRQTIPEVPTTPVISDAEIAFISKFGAGSDWVKAQSSVAAQYAEVTGDINAQIAAMKTEADQYAYLQNVTGKWSAETATAYKKVVDIQTQQMSTGAQFVKDLGTQLADQWSSTLTKVLSGQEKFGDAMRKMWTDIAESITQQLLKMAMMEALFGNQKGTLVSGSGLIGWIGGALGLIKAQEGFSGWVNQPTLFMAGESGREHVGVTPEGKMGKIPVEGGGGNVVVLNVTNNAVDAPSFMDLCQKNPGGFFQALLKDAQGAGVMRTIIKGLTS